ncbi:MAG: tetratricopeptide repeat protein [Rhodospirillales bacterium]|nr:tetratricopeptide repeat protein [Rhodospirillales bacterium]
MNRAEKPRPKKQAPELLQRVQQGIRDHQAGRLAEAETAYRRVLQADPDHADANHLLGLIAHQSGDNEAAVQLISRAIQGNPDEAAYHNNLGNAFKDLEQLNEAAASYREAIAVKPEFVDAHSKLGNTLKDLGRLEEAVTSYRKVLTIQPENVNAHNNLGLALLAMDKRDEAVASYQKALAIKPDLAEVHYNLGLALHDLGTLDTAVESYQKALALQPDFALAHNNLGLIFKDQGSLDEAVASYRKALAIKPDLAEAHCNLGLALRDQGNLDEAYTCQRRAITLNPHNDLFWSGWAASLETHSFTYVDDGLLQDLSQLLERPTVHPSYVTRPIINALRLHPGFRQILEATGTAKPETEIAYGDMAGQLSSIPLFLRVMGLNHICDLDIERMLTVLRRAMLRQTVAGNADDKGLAFSTALALQCFTNEYAFSETDEEKEAVEKLQQQIAALVEKQRDVPPSLVASLGAYRPLYGFPWSRELSEREWTGGIGDVIERQISEPLKEQSLRSQIPRLTSIDNTVSQSVREQYEENPYPRWVRTGWPDKARTIGAILQGAPLLLDLGDYQSPESPDILVAGCGTGQHALGTARRFSNARVLAVDLSLSSLSYALRKTNEFGFPNIEYAQADIMELGGLGRRFDLIECVGVLHHLGDPLAGWRVLVDLLRPQGLMKIGLYSETARQDIVRGRALIAEQGYTSSPEDIRRCRQDIITQGQDGNPEMAKICNAKDFFSLSNCRDLLFHVQEHRFTLPQIKDALQTLELEFLGFEMQDQKPMKMFRKSNPNRAALTSISRWHDFELENPHTFRGMYQFLCKKM